ncbi:hypothetical protein DUNSADRAFT_18260 [Dunaliella salina]|uniref:E3 UFM1-protein ligase 1 homolog n=1 Tax=Dunaliella salina TaxID=3046 RepID=A0ABQ7G0F2_DUNSA|nr:hypothetical protein DUNSADRAFT_18260 [Dunaliella salina]|eukprot:KAF5828079.1 hypothetical protein DUNSADRAFT_18260 [Dunaliella salina]
MMDLNELLSQLQSTQQTEATSRLSERNVIDLVNKLKQLGILGDELLYTINGKEYITTDQLKKEVSLALKQSGGRLALVELPALVGCDLLHCERQAAAVVAEGGGEVLEAQGELITVQYFDAIAGEINDLLQEAGQVSLSDLAVQYALNTELMASMLHSRMGGAIQELGLESAALGGSGGGSVVASIVDELVREGALAGSLKGGGVNWVPAVYSTAQRNAVRSFYEQNGWVGYDTAKRMGIPNASSYLRTAFPDGIPLETALVGPSLLSQVRETSSAAASTSSPAAHPAANNSKGGPAGAAAEKGQQAGGSSDDEDWAANAKRGGKGGKGGKSGGKAGKKGGGAGGAKAGKGAAAASGPGSGAGSKGHSIHGGPLPLTMADLEAQVLELRPDLEGVGTTGSTSGEAGGAAQALAALLLPAAVAAYEATLSAAFTTSVEEKRRAKEALAQALDAAYQRLCLYAVGVEEFALAPAESSPADGTVPAPAAASKGGGQGGEDGDEPATKPAKGSGKKAAAAAERAAAAKERRADKAQPTDAQTEGSSIQPGTQQQQHQQQLQQKGGGDKAAETVYAALVRQALRTSGAEAVDALCKWAQVEHDVGAMSDTPTHNQNTTNSNRAANSAAATAQGSSSGGRSSGGQVMDLVKSPPLSPAERGALLRSLPSDAAAALAAALEAMASASTIRDALEALSHAAEVLGLRLKAVDKKQERAVLAQLRAELLGALSSEHDPAAALALVVPLLFMRVTGKAVAVPGKALAAVLARCGSGSSNSGTRASAGSLSPEALSSVEAFHTQVVEHLVLMGGGGRGSTDESRRQASLAESLAQQLPAMKCLAGLGGE